jgi:hypothetical protein
MHVARVLLLDAIAFIILRTGTSAKDPLLHSNYTQQNRIGTSNCISNPGRPRVSEASDLGPLRLLSSRDKTCHCNLQTLPATGNFQCCIPGCCEPPTFHILPFCYVDGVCCTYSHDSYTINLAAEHTRSLPRRPGPSCRISVVPPFLIRHRKFLRVKRCGLHCSNTHNRSSKVVVFAAVSSTVACADNLRPPLAAPFPSSSPAWEGPAARVSQDLSPHLTINTFQ